MTDFLLLATIFLVAGVVAVPLATRLGLGSVLGYLLAGIVISPILALLEVDVISIQHFAEFGVVMMLFLVGLELEPRTLWTMRSRLLGLGGGQVGITTVLVMAVAMLFGLDWQMALATGLVLALSSTAIVLQTLNEKGLMKSDGGQASFSVLLFQDIAVIPMLALLPLLAQPELVDSLNLAAAEAVVEESAEGHGEDHADDHSDDGHGDGHGEDHGDGHGSSLSLVDNLNGWQTTLVTIGAVAAVILGGTYLTRPLFRFIAQAGLRELFTAAALMIVVGIALLMSLVGLSPALGTFIAGVVLASSEYRHELESDVDPFRGLLLGLFFMTVGAGIDFGLLWSNLFTVLGLTVGLILLKALVMMALAFIFKVRGQHKFLFSLGLAQAGEFGFVLLAFTTSSNILPDGIAALLLLVVALSMLLTPVLFIFYDKVIAPSFEASETREADEIPETGTVVIAGHGRFGGIVRRVLDGAGYSTVVMDYSSAQLEMLRSFGFKAYFGDATRPDLLAAAGISEARMLVIAIDDKEKITELTRYVRQTYPAIHVVARAVDRHHVYELWAAGCRDIIRETFDSSIRASRSALQALGHSDEEAQQMVDGFVDDDRVAMISLASLYDADIPTTQNQPYMEKARELIDMQNEALAAEPGAFGRMRQRMKDRGEDPAELVAQALAEAKKADGQGQA